ncbi:HTH-type transcriptional regulator YhaJ [Burkholderiales bacterium]|nr:HTH-type transcriptional regulator YhaJ [Burkholderiales bacterium]
MLPTLDALAVLDAIDRRGSFAAAADELGRVPSAITYTVRRLEDTLDVLLFDRRGHRARLTPAGRELLASGRRLLDDADALARRVKRVATGWESTLGVAIDAMVPYARVWPWVAAFAAHCQAEDAAHTRLAITREVLGGTWDAVAEGRADLAIGATGDPPPGGGWRTRRLAAVAMVFAVAPSHPIARAREPLSEATIAAHRAVIAADSSRRLPARTAGVLAGQDMLVVPDLDAKLEAQARGLGVGFLPMSLAARPLSAGSLVALATEVPRDDVALQLAWRENRPGRALAWWIDAVTRADWAFAARPGRDQSR